MKVDQSSDVSEKCETFWIQFIYMLYWCSCQCCVIGWIWWSWRGQFGQSQSALSEAVLGHCSVLDVPQHWFHKDLLQDLPWHRGKAHCSVVPWSCFLPLLEKVPLSPVPGDFTWWLWLFQDDGQWLGDHISSPRTLGCVPSETRGSRMFYVIPTIPWSQNRNSTDTGLGYFVCPPTRRKLHTPAGHKIQSRTT